MGNWYGYYSESRRARPQRPAWPTFRRAVGLLRPHGLMLASFLGATAVASLVGLVPPLLIRRIIDHSLPAGDGGQLDLLIGAMVAVILLGSFNGVLQSFLSNSISETVMFDLRNQLFRRLSGMSLS